MLEWLAANIGTIIVALIVIAVIAFVVARMVKDKKRANPPAVQTVRTVRVTVTAIIISKCFVGGTAKKLYPFLFVIEIMNLVLKKFYGVKCIQNCFES